MKSLLDEADEVDEKYKLEMVGLPSSELSTSEGLAIFKSSFGRFKSRIRKHQKVASMWKVTRWTLHDGKKFEDLINRLEKFVNGLESITKSLGLLAEQHARLQEEIETISDIPSLKLLGDASSSHHSILNNDVDTSSRRFIREVAESILEQMTIATRSTGPKTSNSFITSYTKKSTLHEILRGDDTKIPGAWPRSLKSSVEGNKETKFNSKELDFQRFRDRPPLSRTLDTLTDKFIQPKPDENAELWSKVGGTDNEMLTLVHDTESINHPEVQAEDLPQNQRLMRELLRKYHQPASSSFVAGDTNYGEKLITIKKEDENTWHSHNAS